MSLYEGMFVLDNRQANRNWDGSLEKFKGILAKHGAEIVRCIRWGERKLAYEIKGQRRGAYVLTYFNATGEAVNRIYRDCELTDLILRALILKVRSLPSEEEMVCPEEFSSARWGRRRAVEEEPGRREKPAAPVETAEAKVAAGEPAAH